MQKGSHSAELREDIKRIFSLLKRYFQLPTHFQNVYFFWGNFGPKIFSEIFKLKWTMLLLTWPFLPALLLDITIYIQHHFDHFDFSNMELQNITLSLLNTQVCSGDLNFSFHFKTAGVVICMQIAEDFPFFRSYTLQCTFACSETHNIFTPLLQILFHFIFKSTFEPFLRLLAKRKDKKAKRYLRD